MTTGEGLAQLAMWELPTGVNTVNVGKFGHENVEQFSDFLSRTVGCQHYGKSPEVSNWISFNVSSFPALVYGLW